jgi:biotin carboxyl carrier protein
MTAMELVVRAGEREERVSVDRDGDGGRYRVRVGATEHLVDAVAVGSALRSLLLAGEQHEVAVRAERDGRYVITAGGLQLTVEVADPLTHLARQAGGEPGPAGARLVTAYMPGRVVGVLVEEGATVEAGQGLVVLEAMKMQNEIQAERSGTVRRVFVAPGQAVEGGDPLFEIG